jgi:hypothetical protein
LQQAHNYKIAANQKRIENLYNLNAISKHNITKLYESADWAEKIINHINDGNLKNIYEWKTSHIKLDNDNNAALLGRDDLINNKLDFLTRKIQQLDTLEKEMEKILEIHFPKELQHLLQSLTHYDLQHVLLSVKDEDLKDFLSNTFDPSVPMSSPHLCRKRFVMAAIALISGVLGTFMGLYNAHKMNILQKQLKSLAAKHNFLILTTKHQKEHLSALNEKLIELANLVQQMSIHNPTLIATHIEEQLNIFQDRETRVTNVVQELQHHRLLVDLLNFKSAFRFTLRSPKDGQGQWL